MKAKIILLLGSMLFFFHCSAHAYWADNLIIETQTIFVYPVTIITENSTPEEPEELEEGSDREEMNQNASENNGQ